RPPSPPRTSVPTGTKPAPSGTEVIGTRSAPREVLVSLPDDDDGARPAIERQVAKARADIAKALGVPAPPAITVRFHPTTDDNELMRPVSVGALSNAYARARACFAKQIQAGTNWKDVR